MHRCDGFSRASLVAGAALVAVLVGVGAAGSAMAQQPTMEDLMRMMEAQAKEIQALRQRLQQVETKESAPPAVPPAPPLAGTQLAPTVKVPAPLPGQKEQELATSGSFPGSWRIPGTNLSARIYGFAKLDFSYDFRDVGPEDVFVTSSLPTEAGDRSGRTRIHARESRLGFEMRAPTDRGPFKAVIEGDFFGAAVGAGTSDQLQFNSFAFRLRHAYGELGPVLAGQWWTTFGDTTAFLEDLEFFAEPGRVTARTPQIRYTAKLSEKATLAFAVENPEGDVFDNNAAGSGRIQVDGLPDFISHLRYVGTWGHVQSGVVFRQIEVDNTDPALPAGVQSIDDKTFGWGVNVSSRINLKFLHEKDNFKFQVNYGDGLGRYVNDLATNATNSPASFDATFDPVTGDLETIEVLAGYVGYQHWWTNAVRSTFSYSWIDLSYDFAQPNFLDFSQSARVNLYWTPVPRVDFGVQWIWGQRENVNGTRGANNRIQSTAKFSF